MFSHLKVILIKAVRFWVFLKTRSLGLESFEGLLVPFLDELLETSKTEEEEIITDINDEHENEKLEDNVLGYDSSIDVESKKRFIEKINELKVKTNDFVDLNGKKNFEESLNTEENETEKKIYNKVITMYGTIIDILNKEFELVLKVMMLKFKRVLKKNKGI